MRKAARIVTIVSFAVLVIDFLTLENRVVTTSPVAQRIGGFGLLLALAGLVCGALLLIVGSAGRRDHTAPQPAQAPAERAGRRTQPAERRARVTRSRFRAIKVSVGLLVLASWFLGMPVYAYHSLIARAPGFTAGPWVADALLSLLAVAAQCLAPTPIALVFWPSAVIAVYLLLSRKDRPVLDAVFGVIALALVVGLWSILLSGVELGGRPGHGQ